ncbi:MAG: hypothetical protein AAFV53_37200 [Myxococcota bacterium]
MGYRRPHIFAGWLDLSTVRNQIARELAWAQHTKRPPIRPKGVPRARWRRALKQRRLEHRRAERRKRRRFDSWGRTISRWQIAITHDLDRGESP